MKYAILALVFWCNPASAHDWYPTNCCGGQDCHPIPSEDVKEVRGGYMVMNKWFREYAKATPSPDGKYHACVFNGNLLCFYAPTPTY